VAAILVGGLKCWTQIWKGATQGTFHQSLDAIGPMVSDEKIKMRKFTTYDGRHVMAKAHMAFGQIEKRGDEILIVHCCFSISQNELKF
jgi:hypothetical protein